MRYFQTVLKQIACGQKTHFCLAICVRTAFLAQAKRAFTFRSKICSVKPRLGIRTCFSTYRSGTVDDFHIVPPTKPQNAAQGFLFGCANIVPHHLHFDNRTHAIIKVCLQPHTEKRMPKTARKLKANVENRTQPKTAKKTAPNIDAVSFVLKNYSADSSITVNVIAVEAELRFVSGLNFTTETAPDERVNT